MANDTLSIYKGELVELASSPRHAYTYNRQKVQAHRRKNEKEMEQELEWIRQSQIGRAHV